MRVSLRKQLLPGPGDTALHSLAGGCLGSWNWKTSFTALLATVVLFSSCTDRKRLNPLDPANPQTHGRPTGLQVYSIRDSVFLRWDALPLEGLRGFRVWRRVGSDTFRMIAALPGGAASAVDAPVQYGLRYSYTITAVGEDFESPPSDTVTVLPGPTTVVVADLSEGLVARLSHDAAHPIWRSSLVDYPDALTVDRSRGRVWVADGLDGSIVGMALRDGRFLFRLRGFWRPWNLVLFPSDGSLLVADRYGGVVAKVGVDGDVIWVDDRTERPADVAISSGGGYWVLDAAKRTVLHYPGPSSAVDKRCPYTLKDPVALGTDAKGLELWVADRSALYHYDSRLRKWSTVATGLQGVRALTVSPHGGECWFADETGVSGQRVVRIDKEGGLLALSTGWQEVRDLAWSWCDAGVVVADARAGLVVRLDGDGNELGRYEEMVFPTLVAVE